ncbi:respiratory nitrate reductase subunit gamma [Brachybacterium sp. EF45031]|uniref:respiratory nitrate reductase subunit gamma n=1 Tax=Brachybacterium sillae TaxID=2810536 RepID=UPI00217E6259|nr:respiratory nitrate reductase subunit gamma [Brachybacterium sillae]MCS6710863.1 respiratory nitrate reductase subunit gamma [Brachybacterium sillae]
MTDVTIPGLLLWVVVPYMVLAIFVLGHVWRFRHDRFGWTTRSSQIYESRLLAIGSPLFHFGIIGIFFGHVVGLGIPKSWMDAIGIHDHVYHLMAVIIGLAAAVACVGGLLILLYRRRTNRRVFGATTSGDKLMYLVLTAVIVFGVLATVVHSVFGDYDYREGVSVWFRQFWSFRPDPVTMGQAPIFFQLHVLSALALFAIWPFTRLVHVFAVPLGYLTRPYIVYRSKDPRKEAERRGWEKVSF